MKEVKPSPELESLLAEFDLRGGVLDFSFYVFDALESPQDAHRKAAHGFLDACAVANREYLRNLDIESYPAMRNYVYRWDQEKLTGRQIDFATFWESTM